MKKTILITVFVIFTFSVINAQFTKVGGGLAYGSGYYHNNETSSSDHRTPHFGIFLTTIYELSLPIHITPSFTYFIPHITKDSFSGYEYKTVVSQMMFDINGHYVFNSLDQFEFYGLAGLNITYDKIKFVEDYGEGSSTWGDSSNSLGLNLGAGTYMKITEQFDLYGEVKYIISKYDQLLVNVGILINIDWLKKHENSDY